jgi:DNA polymerase-3 subunit epsilon
MSTLPFPLERPIVFLDLETTGLRISMDRIIELALIRFGTNGDVLERVRRFNPEMPIPKEATAVHGITDEDVANEPPFVARARSLFELLDPCDLAGFNLRRFDLPMLLSEFRRAGISFETQDRKLVDVQVIFHREEPRDLGAAVRFYLGRELEDAHSALADIRATAAVLTAQFERYPNLPRDIGGLDQYCNEVRPFQTEVDLWFVTDAAGGRTFRRGKHRDRLLLEVALTEPDYLRWMLANEEMDPSVKEIVRAALSATEGGID